MKNLIVTIALVLTVSAIAQKPSETQYAAYLQASKTLWEKSVKEAENSFGDKSFEKAMALYGLLNNTMASEDEKTFDQYKSMTVDLLKDIIKENEEWGEPRAVLSSVYGLVMAYSPMKGMILGMKSSSLMEEAIKLQPESPLVQKLYAGSKLYTPEMWGGDAKKALEAYQKSLGLFEDSARSGNWIYLDTMMGLAMAYRRTEQDEKAISTLEEAISIEPQYYWAKSTLESLKKS